MKIEKKFGARLRKLRRAQDLSQEALAMDAGTNRTYVSELERGIKSPTISTLEQLAKSLSMSISELCEGL
ncbi:MAG: helix-turn-helix transcriptional regulator [Gammaproteobacteria bacterium]|nr:helix-turn-helix transcriptional regulator [Gammaproteobacteria bacterium]